ncbi:MAG: carboxymuconolactone decarboxylase family protein [Gammaproteobacteria bacterium]|nr:carboxymuconolactone decarboxylase family protein [Gammaproteobacteria bacterium]
MSYISTPDTTAYPWFMRLLFRMQRRRYGRELESVKLWGRVPWAYLAMTAMYRVLDRKSSSIEPALRSLIQTRVSQINQCAFCIDLNSDIGLGRGVSKEKLGALPQFEVSAQFSEYEKAALAYAETITYSDRRVDDRIVSRLRQHFDDQAIIELAALIAYQNMSSKFNAALGVPAQGFCTLPAQESRRASVADENKQAATMKER